MSGARWGRAAAAAAVLLAMLAWALAPAARAVLLVRRAPAPVASADTTPRATAVEFRSSDGIRLSGLYEPVAGGRGTVILVHGFKTSGDEMRDWAAMLRLAGYDVLLYDGRGCGTSDGTFGVGATEDRDIVGAVSFIRARGGPGADHIGVLGISLGAGDALVAAARDPRIDAVIADSPWADERVQLARMATVPLGPLSVPLLSYEPLLLDALIGGRLEDARPRDVVGRIAPRATLIIHSLDDDNVTTTLDDAQALFAAAGEPKELWLAPRGGHAGAFRDQPGEYRARVLVFLAKAFGTAPP